MTDKDLKKAFGEQDGECGLVLNIKNLHIHLDERMTNNTYYHEPHYDAVGDPFDEDDDGDEDDGGAAGTDGGCEHCADCDSCAETRDASTVASIHSVEGCMVPMEELVEAIHGKTDVGNSTVYRVLNSFFKCLDERSESVLKGHSAQSAQRGDRSVKKGAAYED